LPASPRRQGSWIDESATDFLPRKVIHLHPQPHPKAIRQLRKQSVGFSSMQSINAPSALRENGWIYLQPGDLPDRVWETGPLGKQSIGSPDASFAERYVMGCPELLEFGGKSKTPAWKGCFMHHGPWFETFFGKVRTNRQEMACCGTPCVLRLK
jgi:hypothetical protein